MLYLLHVIQRAVSKKNSLTCRNYVQILCAINLSLKYVLKVKLNPNIYPNILSEIIGLHENEGRGGNLAQISN